MFENVVTHQPWVRTNSRSWVKVSSGLKEEALCAVAFPPPWSQTENEAEVVTLSTTWCLYSKGTSLTKIHCHLLHSPENKSEFGKKERKEQQPNSKTMQGARLDTPSIRFFSQFVMISHAFSLFLLSQCYVSGIVQRVECCAAAPLAP